MKKIIEFEINNKIYSIYDIDEIEGKDSYVGESRYEQGIILIEYGTKEQMLTTLKHELAHVWLYENGHSEQAEGCFTYEDLCEYIALSCNSVYNITEKYKSEKCSEEEKRKCEGISITIDGDLKCNNNSLLNLKKQYDKM